MSFTSTGDCTCGDFDTFGFIMLVLAAMAVCWHAYAYGVIVGSQQTALDALAHLDRKLKSV